MGWETVDADDENEHHGKRQGTSTLTSGKLWWTWDDQYVAKGNSTQNSQRFVGASSGLVPSQPLRTWPTIQTDDQVFHRYTKLMFQETHASVSLVLSILQLIGQKSQHPRIISLCKIDVVKKVVAVELLELPRYLGIRKCIPIPWIVSIVQLYTTW